MVGTENRRYVYVFVRENLEMKDKLVQASHAVYDSAQKFKNHADRTTILVLSMGNKTFNEIQKHLNSHSIECTIFTEYGLGLGKTALATEAVTEEQRTAFKRFSLMKI